MKSTQPQLNLARLKRALQKHGVPQNRVASEAGVSKFMVCHVLAGRAKSARVVAIARRLLADAKAANGAAA